MPPPSRIVPIVAPVLRYGASTRLGLCAAKPKPLAEQLRHHFTASKKKLIRELRRETRTGVSKVKNDDSMTESEKRAHFAMFKEGGGPLFPGTFISLPLSRLPRTPSALAQYNWGRLRSWIAETVSLLTFKLRSMPNWTTRPKWKARRGAIAPTAKALYQEMLEAYAAGDKTTIWRVCVNDFGRKLLSAMDRRHPRERVRFEITKYNGVLFYPRLKSHQIHQANPYDKHSVTEQAIVAISSTQQVSRYDVSTGETIPGSVKIQDKVEYVVLSRQVSAVTFEADRWRIWGTTSATSLEDYLQEQEVINKEQAKRAGWKSAA